MEIWGWLGQVYDAARYRIRGRFSRRRFEDACLTEYCETFPTVCGDFAFYQFPSDDHWQRLFDQVPANFQFTLKVPEEITCPTFPSHPRYGPRAGKDNPSFLDVHLLQEAFLRPLERYCGRIGVLIFEFGAFRRRTFENLEQFVSRLDPFLRSLPAGWRYSVEVRNKEYLERAYFDCLGSHRVAHVFNGWTRMPLLESQIQIPDAFTADFIVCRALLRHGRTFEAAVEKFAPYSQTMDPCPEARGALRSLIEVALERRRAGYVYVNNRLEGNAPLMIEAVVQGDANAARNLP